MKLKLSAIAAVILLGIISCNDRAISKDNRDISTTELKTSEVNSNKEYKYKDSTFQVSNNGQQSPANTKQTAPKRLA